MKRIGILETGHPSSDIAHHGHYPQMFRAYFAGHPELAFSDFDVTANALPAPNGCHGWIITGSNAGVYENHPWIPPLMEFIRAAMRLSVPMLGICFGHQIMAEALGGHVVKSEKGRGLGLHRYEITEQGRGLLPGAKEMSLIAAHQDQVVKLPPETTVLAVSEFCPYAALAFGKSGLSVQAHPEFTAAFEENIIESWQREDPIAPALNEAAVASLKGITGRTPDAESLVPAFAGFLLS